MYDDGLASGHHTGRGQGNAQLPGIHSEQLSHCNSGQGRYYGGTRIGVVGSCKNTQDVKMYSFLS